MIAWNGIIGIISKPLPFGLLRAKMKRNLRRAGFVFFKIETPAKFFQHIVTEDVSHFLSTEANLRAAYHACTSLLSYRNWILAAYKGSGWSSNNVAQAALVGADRFQRALETIEPHFATVTDLANASKHMILDSKRARTELYGNANTQVEEVGGSIGESAIGEIAVAGSTRCINVKIGDAYHDVRPCVQTVFKAWQELNIENSW